MKWKGINKSTNILSFFNNDQVFHFENNITYLGDIIINLNKIKNKLIQSLKRREEQKVKQINKLSKLVHENGKLKERTESFIPSFLRSPNDYIHKLKKASNPENINLKIIN